MIVEVRVIIPNPTYFFSYIYIILIVLFILTGRFMETTKDYWSANRNL